MSRGGLIAAALIALASCKSDLRGDAKPSPDGRTYLVVDDGYGPGCLLFVDGHPWGHAVHASAPVTPGRHTIECHFSDGSGQGGGITFTVRAGTTFHFDYWGP
jgi:hypothetical protein